jgi:phospholipase/carboxylesterase
MANLAGPVWGPTQTGAPEQLVFLIHGLGADGSDLISLAPYFAPFLRRALFLAPNAPFPCDMAPFGRQWFSFRNLDPAALEDGVRHAAPILEAFIEAELTRWNLSDYALLGFSQGAMMSLFNGLRSSTIPPRAILAYSGALLAPRTLAAEAMHNPPILIAHGEMDNIVPATRSYEAEDRLRAAGLAVETVYEPELDHSIGEAGLKAGAALLARVFRESL